MHSAIMSLRLAYNICIKAMPTSSTALVTKICVRRMKPNLGHRSLVKIDNQSRCFSTLNCQIFRGSARVRCFSSSIDCDSNNIKQKRRQTEHDPEVEAWMNQLALQYSEDTDRESKWEPEANVTSNSSSISRGNVTKSHIEIEDFGYQHREDEEEDEDYVPERNIPISTKRGNTGPFDVEELVMLLEKENGVDIRVLDIPPHLQFVSHMVIVSGKSLRHMRAMAASIEWMYKKKRLCTDRPFRLEGRNCKNWFAMDLGNIAVHIFMPETRQHYDLETLWTLGPEFDDPRHYTHDESLNLSPAELLWLESTQRETTTPPGESSSDGESAHTEFFSSDNANSEQKTKSLGDMVQGDSQRTPGVKIT